MPFLYHYASSPNIVLGLKIKSTSIPQAEKAKGYEKTLPSPAPSGDHMAFNSSNERDRGVYFPCS